MSRHNDDDEDEKYGCCGWALIVLSYFLFIITIPFSLFVTIKVVREYERAVILRLGRKLPGGAKGPGLFFILPCIDDLIKVDLRTVTFDIPPQEILTKDSVTVTVDGVVYYKIDDPVSSVINIENARYSTGLLAATTLRNTLGTKSLQEILKEKDQISAKMQNVLDTATDDWGIKVERVEIKDVRLPNNMQRAMAAEAEASREANAKVISAEGEQKASQALKEAADVINQSPVALQLRYLQTLTTVAAEKNSTIIFPIPIEMLSQFASKDRYPRQVEAKESSRVLTSSRRDISPSRRVIYSSPPATYSYRVADSSTETASRAPLTTHTTIRMSDTTASDTQPKMSSNAFKTIRETESPTLPISTTFQTVRETFEASNDIKQHRY